MNVNIVGGKKVIVVDDTVIVKRFMWIVIYPFS